MKIQKMSGSLMVTIPKDVIKKKEWQQGDDLICSINKDGAVEFRKI